MVTLLGALVAGIAASAVLKAWIAVIVLCAVPTCMLVLLVLLYFFGRNSFQLWALQRPRNIVTRLLLPPIALVESLGVGRPQDILALKEKWGPNFCASGQVWLGSYRDVTTALTSPQAKTHNLGEHPLMYSKLPDVQNSRNVALLCLSDRGAGGNGDHEAFRSCVEKYVFTPAVEQRRTDATSKALFKQLADDYTATQCGKTGGFYSDHERGLTAFLVKYLNYVLFAVDVHDKLAQGILTQFLGFTEPMVSSMYPFGYFMDYSSLFYSVGEIYEKSPVLAHFEECPAFHRMTRKELALLMAGIVRIAGIPGTRLMTSVTMGGVGLPEFPGATKTDVAKVWDSLDLEDTEQIHRYIMECSRLGPAVSVSHRIATEDFSVEIAGKIRSFPKGTNIAIPVFLGAVDKDFWGPDAYEFNMARENLVESFLGFNSVGGRHAGRECPGKDLAMATVTEILQVLGRCRRSQQSQV